MVRKIKPRLHVDPLVKELFAEIERKSWRLVDWAAASGLDPNTFTNWQRVNPSLSNFIAAANALGFDVKLVRQE